MGRFRLARAIHMHRQGCRQLTYSRFIEGEGQKPSAEIVCDELCRMLAGASNNLITQRNGGTYHSL